MPHSIESIETVGGGNSVGVGCIRHTNFPDGAHFKFVKHRIDAIDTENYGLREMLNNDEIKAGKEQAMGLYKACEEYLATNTDVFA
ncbi:major pollen allergen Aln g 1-like [Sesamum indicum]|uniref:Major pollen allergen Aln g 1-like n=1 Tax=Sesamum indicum TaxID=4182 RepID=A0A8M8UWA7_SESIN|nr:major pollen allergen Aln g 1-like [Sesamum indicum]